MKEYKFIFSSTGELALVNKIINENTEECMELKHNIDVLLNVNNESSVAWRKIIELIDEDNSAEICFINIYSNYKFYEGIISGIYEYDNPNNTKFSIEFRLSPVVIDNTVLNRIDIFEKDAYKHFKNKFSDLNNLDATYYDADFLYYFFAMYIPMQQKNLK